VTSGFPGDNDSGVSFNSGIIPYRSFFTYTFNQHGTYPYYCTIHPWRSAVVTVSAAIDHGRNFDLRTGNGQVFDLNQDDRTVFDFKPTTIAQTKDTPLTYNVSLFTPNSTRVFSHSFYALNNDLQIELIQNRNVTTPANQTAVVYGPDVTDPITGTYHVSGPLFNQDGKYAIRAEITAIGNQLPSQRIIDDFNFNVVGSTSRSNITHTSTTMAVNTTTGKTFNVTLGSNPTTGYQWQVAGIGDTNLVKFMQSTYVPPQSNLLGAPGKQILTFEALKQGRTIISLGYVRPWEPWNIADSKIIDVTIGS
jgi:predicted secreted protein